MKSDNLPKGKGKREKGPNIEFFACSPLSLLPSPFSLDADTFSASC
jgi:hypothetical protein